MSTSLYYWLKKLSNTQLSEYPESLREELKIDAGGKADTLALIEFLKTLNRHIDYKQALEKSC